MASYQHPTKISGYDVECIGTGTMGYVYKAIKSHDGVKPLTFAFKTIRLDDKTRTEVAAFERRMAVDVRASQRLKHENVVRVDGIGDDENLRLKYIMMEYVEGKDLKQLTDSAFPPAFDMVKSIILQLLAALQHVHEQHVIHRDIKPANVMLTRDGKVKLVDFGVALIDEPNDETRTVPEIVGSPDYMAPEQMQTGLVDGRADLYSTGAVLYELLTRKRAFQGYNRDHMPPPTGLNRAFHYSVDAVISKALAKDPNERYQSAREFQAALERAGRVNNVQALLTSVAVVGAVAVGIAIINRPNTHENNGNQGPKPGPSASDSTDTALTPPDQTACEAAVEKKLNELNKQNETTQRQPLGAIVNDSNENLDRARMTIVTGPPGLTFYPMGINLAEVASKDRLKLFVMHTKGTLDNIYKIAGKDNAGVGFVQGDIKLFFALSPNPDLKETLNKLFLLTSLYKEEVHVLVRRDFVNKNKPKSGLSILEGQTVLTASESTGSEITAKNLFGSHKGAGVRSTLSSSYSGVSAICRVATGEAQAMVVTAGAPANLLKAIDGLKPMYQKQLQLLPLEAINKSQYRVYEPGTIHAKDYSWLNEDVPTLSIRSLLMAYRFNKDSPLGKLRCPQIAELKQVIMAEIDKLKLNSKNDPNIHPKWPDVQLGEPVFGWTEVDGC